MGQHDRLGSFLDAPSLSAWANSGMFVLATTTAPAARRRRTTGASAEAGLALARMIEPARVGSPTTSNKSLMLTILPSSGPSEIPLRARASAASAAARAVSV
jgi:hypothetical protein